MREFSQWKSFLKPKVFGFETSVFWGFLETLVVNHVTYWIQQHWIPGTNDPLSAAILIEWGRYLPLDTFFNNFVAKKLSNFIRLWNPMEGNSVASILFLREWLQTEILVEEIAISLKHQVSKILISKIWSLADLTVLEFLKQLQSVSPLCVDLLNQGFVLPKL